jgi:hypothetical protein
MKIEDFERDLSSDEAEGKAVLWFPVIMATIVGLAVFSLYQVVRPIYTGDDPLSITSRAVMMQWTKQ